MQGWKFEVIFNPLFFRLKGGFSPLYCELSQTSLHPLNSTDFSTTSYFPFSLAPSPFSLFSTNISLLPPLTTFTSAL
jgi:hypothetical protein